MSVVVLEFNVSGLCTLGDAELVAARLTIAEVVETDDVDGGDYKSALVSICSKFYCLLVLNLLSMLHNLWSSWAVASDLAGAIYAKTLIWILPFVTPWTQYLSIDIRISASKPRMLKMYFTTWHDICTILSCIQKVYILQHLCPVVYVPTSLCCHENRLFARYHHQQEFTYYTTTCKK